MKNCLLKHFKQYLIVACLTFPFIVTAQVIITKPSNYAGYNVSCKGDNDGAIEIDVVGDGPFLFTWSNGSYSKNQYNLTAGVYTVVVTDINGNTASADVELVEPKLLEVFLEPEIREGGFNISEMNGNDGVILSAINGGIPPYTYSWGNGGTGNKISELTAGAYTLTVTGTYGCTAAASATLTQPSLLHIVSITSPNHHGYNISCNEKKDGIIDLTVTGGVPPYKFTWSDGYTTEDRTELIAGLYSVIVRDANGVGDAAQILLTEPTRFDAQLTANVYSNGKHVSCYGCTNASITTTVSGGVSPYTYLWNTGVTSANLSNIGVGAYSLAVIDVNGCGIDNVPIDIQGPDREDWTMMGNSGTDPATNFFGSIDNKDVVFRSNNVERLRIKADGTLDVDGILKVSNTINFNNNRTIGYQPALSGSPEILSFGNPPNNSLASISSCFSPNLNTQLNYQFNGTIQLYGNSYLGGNLNVMEVGFDGANAIIDATGTSTDPTANRLLLNYYCGRDVFVGNGGSGDLTANHNMFVTGRLGIGTTDPKEGLQIGDQFTLRGDPANSIIGHNYTYSGTPIASRRIKQGFVSRMVMGAMGDVLIQTAPDDAASSVISHTDWKTGFKLLNDGKVGIGIDPLYQLHVNGDAEFLSGDNTVNGFQIVSNKIPTRRGIRLDPNPAGNFDFYIHKWQDNESFNFFANDPSNGTINNLLSINGNGKVSIGGVNYVPDGYVLGVHGKMVATEIVVLTELNWPDYVLKENYSLPDLKELKNFIQEYNHLPGIPSASEIEQSGLSIGTLLVKQMEKIEELTLYVLKLQEQIDEMNTNK